MFTRPLTLAACLISTSLWAQPALPPLDMVPEADLSPTIEWSEDWQKSLQLNSERWRKELEAEPDRPLRDRRLDARQAALLRAAREKWPAAKDDPRLTLGLADRLGQMGAPAHRAEELKALTEARPGDFATAVEALQKILQSDPWSAISLPAGTIEYAIDRLDVMERGGYLPPGDPAVGKGYLLLAEMRRLQGRAIEAAEALRHAEARLGRPLQLLWTKARVMVNLGLRDAARLGYEEVERAADTRDAERARSEITWALEQLSSAGPLPTVAGNRGLGGRWEALRDAAGPVDPAAVTRLLEDPEAVRGVVELGNMRHGSLWSALVTLLEGRHPDVVAALATTSAAPAEEAAMLASTDVDLLLAHRRFPWAESIHRAMLAAGEQALWRGEYGGASRWFQDVGARSRSTELRDYATVGHWLALSQAGDMESLEAALGKELEAGKNYAWRGGTISGRELAEQLRKSAATMEITSIEALPREAVVLALPAVETWAPVMAGGLHEQRRAAAEAVPWPTIGPEGQAFVAGPSYVAAFDAKGKPTWSRVNRVFDGVPVAPETVLVPPTSMRPMVDRNVVIARGAPAAETAAPTALIAYDTATGAPRWSSQGIADWDGLVPVSDPTYADGRAYVLAMNEGVLATAHVIAFDPATGGVHWKRPLAAQTPSIQIGGNRALNLARYGSPPTIAGGALYVSTNLGIVAKLDVRDGTVDWMSFYGRTSINREGFPLIRARGSSPVICGSLVVLAVRDRQGLFAFDAETGSPVWENTSVPSYGMIGETGGVVIAFDERVIAAVDAKTGHVRWWRPSERTIDTPPQLIGDTVVVTDGGTLLELNATTGLEAGRREWKEARPAAFTGSAGHVAIVTAENLGTTTVSEDLIEGGIERRLSRTSPMVIVPPSGTSEVMLVRSGELLEALEVTARPTVRWRRRLPVADGLIYWLRDGFVLKDEQAVEFVRLRDGATVWRTDLPWPVTLVATGDEGVAVASFPENTQVAPRLAMLDVGTGQLRWQRTIAEQGRTVRVAALGFHSGLLHVVGADEDQRKPPRRVTFELTTGKIRNGSTLDEGASRGIRFFGIANGRAWLLRESGELRIVPTEGEASTAKLDGYVNRNGAGTWTSPDGNILCLMQRSYDWRIRKTRETAWVVPLSSPSSVRKLTNSDFAIAGAKAATIGEKTAGIADLAAGDTATTFALPNVEGEFQPIAAAFDPKGERAALLSEVTTTDQTAYTRERLRVDIFDARGAHLASAPVLGGSVGNAIGLTEIDGRPTREGRLVWHEHGLVVTSRDAVSFLSVPTSMMDAPPDVTVAFRASDIFAVDGDLSEWSDVPKLQLGATDGGSLQLFHDGKRLFLAVSHPQPMASPLLGTGPGSAGSWLEIGSAPHKWGEWRCGTGADSRSQAVWFPLDDDLVPADAAAAIRYDAAAHELRYELSIPLEHVARGKNGGWHEAGLSVAAWKSGMGLDALGRFDFGGGLERPTLYAPALGTVRLEPAPKTK